VVARSASRPGQVGRGNSSRPDKPTKRTVALEASHRRRPKTIPGLLAARPRAIRQMILFTKLYKPTVRDVWEALRLREGRGLISPVSKDT